MNIHTNFWIIHPAPNIVLTAPNGSEIIYRLNSIQSNLLTVAGVPQRHILGLNAVNTWNSFKFCRVWRGGGNALVHLCNPRNRTWRGHLVRDVEIKNKSPVSWSCFPPGSRLSVSCLFISLGRRDYKWCELCGWNSQLGMYSTFELCTCFVISASLRFLLVILVKLAPPLTTSYMQEEHFNGWDQA